MKTKDLIISLRLQTVRMLLAGALLALSSVQAGAFGTANHQAITGDAVNGWTTSTTASRLKLAVVAPDQTDPYDLVSFVHCDNCTWDGTGDWIARQREAAALAAFRYHSSKLDSDFQDFANHIGFILHATQDFYAHSNWIETRPLNFLANLDMPKPTWWVSGTFADIYDVGPNSGIALCPPGTPTHTQLNKDYSNRPGFQSAYADAVYASREELRIFQEKVRSLYGLQADSILTDVGFINLTTHKRLGGVILYPASAKLYFFRGSDYFRLTLATNTVDTSSSYPKPIAGNWTGVWTDGIDAAVTWKNGKIYFFKGDNYIQYDIAADRADSGYPKNTVLNWSGLWPDGMNAAINVDNSKAYFFKGTHYIRYDMATNRADPGFPRAIAADFPGVWEDGVDAAVYIGSGKVYFFKGALYLRYDIYAKKVDFTSPQPIADKFKGIEVR
jgi:hypothetical protein